MRRISWGTNDEDIMAFLDVVHLINCETVRTVLSGQGRRLRR